MTATSLAFRAILAHYLPGLLALPGTFVLVALILWPSGQQVSPDSLVCWIRNNLGLASFGLLVVPLVVGILLDMWRHAFWPLHEDEDDRWEVSTRRLSQLPEFLFRFMHDEYYYYVEFEGNSALALPFDLVLVIPYTLLTYGLGWTPLILLVVGLVLTRFLWVSYYRSLGEFFEDLEDTTTQYEQTLKERVRG
jgi:hypothetical protein